MEANTHTSPQAPTPVHPIIASLLGAGIPVMPPAASTGSGESADREAADGTVKTAGSSPEPPKVLSENYLKRHETHVVKTYLNELADNATEGQYSLPALEARLAQVEQALETQKDPLRRVFLAQKRIDLIAQVRKARIQTSLKESEQEFIKVAKSYSERKGITYMAWREIGVPAKVLRAAGVKRNRVDSIDHRWYGNQKVNK